MEIRDAVSVVTGSASGIGRATALELVRRGASVVAADIHEERLEELRVEIEEMGGRVLTVRCDVAYDAQVEHLRTEALEEMGRVDIVVNNAGVGVWGPPETISMDDWEWIIQVNLYGTIRGVRAFLPQMLERGSGHVVNTASLAGLYASSWDGIPYVTTKFGVTGFTEGLALYTRPLGVGVTLVCPALVETDFGSAVRFTGVSDPSEWIRSVEYPPPVPAADVATQTCDAIEADTFLVLTEPELVTKHTQQRGADYNGFIADRIAQLPEPPNLHR